MFGTVKKWLGIEGVKLELILPEEIAAFDGIAKGKIRFFSMNAQTVTAIRVRMVEKFSRGRRGERLTDEYELGQISLEKVIEIPANESVELAFTLPFEMMKSEIDQMEEGNIILNGLAKTAKWIRGVKSEYSIIAEAKVKGVALSPFDKQTVVLI